MVAMALDVAFDRMLEHGRCVGVRIPEGEDAIDALAADELLVDERAFARSLAPLRRRTWVAGRVALRHAIQRSGLAAPAVLATERGAPRLPFGVAGSVTHKELLAMALVAPELRGSHIGIDLEVDAVRPTDIASRVLSAEERTELDGLDAAARAREVLLRFSLKEAIYKALDPFVQRYVGFDEVSASPCADGRVRVAASLRPGEGPFRIDALWLRWEGHVVATARVCRATPVVQSSP